MQSEIQIHGHRGCRGYYPENTLKGDKKALQLGSTAVELDVVVSKDKRLVVSHEPYMNHLFCLKPDGSKITQDTEADFNFFEMKLAHIQEFDCGYRTDEKYPQQLQIKEHKPSLEEVVSALPADTFFNIEVKSEQQWYEIYQPDVKTYAKLVANFIEEHLLYNRCLVQSFDPRFLNAFKELVNDKVVIGYLVEYNLNPVEQLNNLHFKPEYFNPDFTLLTDEHLAYLKSKQIKTLVWTVNELTDIQKMISLGVDGIISDYPDRVVEVLKNKKGGI